MSKCIFNLSSLCCWSKFVGSCSEKSKNTMFTIHLRLGCFLFFLNNSFSFSSGWDCSLSLISEHDERVKLSLLLNLTATPTHVYHLFVPLLQWAEAGLLGPSGQSATLNVGGAGSGAHEAAPIRPLWMEVPSVRARPSSGWPAPRCAQVPHWPALFHTFQVWRTRTSGYFPNGPFCLNYPSYFKH